MRRLRAILTLEAHLYHCVPDKGGADFPLERDGEIPGHGGGEQRLIAEMLKEWHDMMKDEI